MTRIQTSASGSPAVVKTACTSGMSSAMPRDLVDRRRAGEAQLGERLERPAELGVVDARACSRVMTSQPLEPVDAAA